LKTSFISILSLRQCDAIRCHGQDKRSLLRHVIVKTSVHSSVIEPRPKTHPLYHETEKVIYSLLT
jgi:hypothetical protein